MKKNYFILNLLLAGIFMGITLFTGCEKDEFPVQEEDQAILAEENGHLKSVPANGTFIITNRNSGKALDVNTSNNDVIQYSYWGESPEFKIVWAFPDLIALFKIFPAFAIERFDVGWAIDRFRHLSRREV